MRTSTFLIILAALIVGFRVHQARAFNTYMYDEANCENSDDDTGITCEDQDIGDCCEAGDGETYQSASVDDDSYAITLYSLNNMNDVNKCGLVLDNSDACATATVNIATGAGVYDDDEYVPSDPGATPSADYGPPADDDPTTGTSDGSDDGGSDGLFRRHGAAAPRDALREQKREEVEVRKISSLLKPSNMDKTPAAKPLKGKRTVADTFFYRNATHIYTMKRHLAEPLGYKQLSTKEARRDFMMKYGEAKPR